MVVSGSVKVTVGWLGGGGVRGVVEAAKLIFVTSTRTVQKCKALFFPNPW